MSCIDPNLLQSYFHINFLHTQIMRNQHKIAIDPYELQIYNDFTDS